MSVDNEETLALLSSEQSTREDIRNEERVLFEGNEQQLGFAGQLQHLRFVDEQNQLIAAESDGRQISIFIGERSARAMVESQATRQRQQLLANQQLSGKTDALALEETDSRHQVEVEEAQEYRLLEQQALISEESSVRKRIELSSLGCAFLGPENSTRFAKLESTSRDSVLALESLEVEWLRTRFLTVEQEERLTRAEAAKQEREHLVEYQRSLGKRQLGIVEAAEEIYRKGIADDEWFERRSLFEEKEACTPVPSHKKGSTQSPRKSKLLRAPQPPAPIPAPPPRHASYQRPRIKSVPMLPLKRLPPYTTESSPNAKGVSIVKGQMSASHSDETVGRKAIAASEERVRGNLIAAFHREAMKIQPLPSDEDKSDSDRGRGGGSPSADYARYTFLREDAVKRRLILEERFRLKSLVSRLERVDAELDAKAARRQERRRAAKDKRPPFQMDSRGSWDMTPNLRATHSQPSSRRASSTRSFEPRPPTSGSNDPQENSSRRFRHNLDKRLEEAIGSNAAQRGGSPPLLLKVAREQQKEAEAANHSSVSSPSSPSSRSSSPSSSSSSSSAASSRSSSRNSSRSHSRDSRRDVAATVQVTTDSATTLDPASLVVNQTDHNPQEGEQEEGSSFVESPPRQADRECSVTATLTDPASPPPPQEGNAPLTADPSTGGTGENNAENNQTKDDDSDDAASTSSAESWHPMAH